MIFQVSLACSLESYDVDDSKLYKIRELSIYINEMVMPVKNKGTLIIIFGITISLIYIYWTRAQVVGNGFYSSVVEHWSSNPEDVGSIPNRKALELYFSQLAPVWVL